MLYGQTDGLSIKTNNLLSSSLVVELSREFVLTDNPSVCPYLYSEGLSDEPENACLISMQARRDGISFSSIP